MVDMCKIILALFLDMADAWVCISVVTPGAVRNFYTTEDSPRPSGLSPSD